MKRIKVFLSFEIDDSEEFSDIDYLKEDFLGELSCCVNMPYEDTFEISVVYPEGIVKTA